MGFPVDVPVAMSIALDMLASNSVSVSDGTAQLMLELYYALIAACLDDDHDIGAFVFKEDEVSENHVITPQNLHRIFMKLPLDCSGIIKSAMLISRCGLVGMLAVMSSWLPACSGRGCRGS